MRHRKSINRELQLLLKHLKPVITFMNCVWPSNVCMILPLKNSYITQIEYTSKEYTSLLREQQDVATHTGEIKVPFAAEPTLRFFVSGNLQEVKIPDKGKNPIVVKDG